MAEMFFLRYPEGRERAVTLSYDDGLPADRRLATLLDGAGMRATFNVNSMIAASEEAPPYDPEKVTRANMWSRMKKSEMLALYRDSGHEVACHGAWHWSEAMLSDGDIASEIITDRQCHERDYGGICRGMAYPNGSFDERVASLLGRLGIAYARTTRETEKFTLPRDFLLWDPTCRHANVRLSEIVDRFLEGDVGIREDGRLFYLWGHTSEFEVHKNWDVIENFVARVGGRPEEIWYPTNLELVDYVNAYRALRFNLAHTYVENPTGLDVWFESLGRVWCVRAGASLVISDETVSLKK